MKLLQEIEIIHKEEKYLMAGIPDDTIFSYWKKHHNFYEIHLLEWIGSIYTGGTILDIGAHFGNHTIYFGEILKAPTISFEPHPANFNALKQNIEHQSRKGIYDIRNIGLWDKECRMQCNKSGSAQASYTESQDSNGVPGKTLDNILPPIDNISVIKIDTEDTEFEILEGALETIRKHRPILLLETAHGTLPKHYITRFFDKYSLSYSDDGDKKRRGFATHAFIPS